MRLGVADQLEATLIEDPMVDLPPTDTQMRMRDWFRAKRNEYLASAELAASHSGLIGGHREVFLRTFLGEFLPGRLSADRGIVHNSSRASGECDAVIWDKTNYPRLAMLDHSAFFINSVVCVIELKSNYSASEMEQARERCALLKQMSIGAKSNGLFLRLEHRLEYVESQVNALMAGGELSGMVIADPRVAYGTVFLKGGGSLAAEDVVGPPDEIADRMPDFVAFLQPGRFFRKFEPNYDEWQEGQESGVFHQTAGEDTFALMANEIMRIIYRRSFGTEGMYDISAYLPWGLFDEERVASFRPRHFPAGYSRHFSFPDDEVAEEPDRETQGSSADNEEPL